MYKINNLEKIQSDLVKLFPNEKNYIGRLAESMLYFDSRMYEVAIAENKLRRDSFRNSLILTLGLKFKLKPLLRFLNKRSLRDFQQEFFDKYIAFLQSYYALLSTTALFVKTSEHIEKQHISTGNSMKKFLETCKENKIIENNVFQILNQARINSALFKCSWCHPVGWGAY
ncbi:MAG: hypothetical protein UT50_C0025G0006 [Candidatus Moranbacteria bacterium GW2011_GWA2_39_41]|nr:MAG: hypothetical protein UT50_C0025G0006 [Candidatus Moranbacteria bacterium GW2011_GWA2_39_41]